MCGICGIVCSDSTYVPDLALLTAMRDSLSHRGPDDAGNYVGNGIALASRRLAILDLSERGHMPMSTPDERYWIVHNGEIYNYCELRSELQAKGHRFSSDTDTEVLLHLYVDRGVEMLSRLNGMFAFAIWDNRDRTLFIARDRLGIKPLYYAEYSGGLYFASEEKALIAAGIPFQFDPEVWPELLYFRYVAGERTPFAGIKRLLPGHFMLCQDGRIAICRWWNLAERAQERADGLPPNVNDWYRETFDDAVALRRISDVPIGVLLSGGLDSSSVAAALARQTNGSLASFTVSFAEDGYDESPLARDVVGQYGLEFHQRQIAPPELFALIQDASWFNDEPLVHGNDAHLLAISQYAKSRVTVLLSGEGADETLGGYVRYRPLHYARYIKLANILPTIVDEMLLVMTRSRYRLNKLMRFISLGSIDSFVLFNACDVLPGELKLTQNSFGPSAWPYRERILGEARALYPDDRVRQAMYVDQHTFLCSLLDRNDRMTMGASIECRVPFLDYRLVETLAALPSKALISRAHNKHLLRSAVGQRLPQSVLRHAKWGFGVPWTTYLREREEFAGIVRGLPESDLMRSSPLDLAWLRSIVRGFFEGDNRHAILLRQLAMIEIWHDTFTERATSTLSLSS